VPSPAGECAPVAEAPVRHHGGSRSAFPGPAAAAIRPPPGRSARVVRAAASGVTGAARPPSASGVRTRAARSTLPLSPPGRSPSRSLTATGLTFTFGHAGGPTRACSRRPCCD
jgi:hypothetical protein